MYDRRIAYINLWEWSLDNLIIGTLVRVFSEFFKKITD